MNHALIVIAVLALVACTTAPQTPQGQLQPASITSQSDLETEQQEAYNPRINPAEFSATINNKYFTLIPGTTFVYEGRKDDGVERVEVYVTEDTKTVMGVNARVVWDRVWLDGSLIEDTKDWYSQDEEGNVWYFGEDSHELVDGKIVNNAGSWEAGVNGAMPGIIMQADPQVGQAYYQEYYPGVAMDRGEALALDEDVSVPYGALNNCLKTLDGNPLEGPINDEHKYYCPSVGFVVLEVGLEDGERIELVAVHKNVAPPPDTVIAEKAPVLKTEITEDDAARIALEAVPGKVTDVAIEKKLGAARYVVEIQPQNGPETDVIIDIDTGEILAVET